MFIYVIQSTFNVTFEIAETDRINELKNLLDLIKLKLTELGRYKES